MGDVNVLKFLYLRKSYALTVPSLALETRANPLRIQAMPVTSAVWFLKVTVQNPEVVDQIFTFPSVPPVAILEPHGE